VSDEQPREPKGVSGGRFTPKPNQEPTLDLGMEVKKVNAVEDKARQNLDKTIQAIRTALEKGKQLVALGRQRFDDDWMVQDAAITTVTQIAEAAKRLPKSFKDARPEVPWRSVTGMRNMVIHEYAIVDLPLVWETLERGFPQIEESVFRSAAE
jgi:uncharacterized protein with HEPN domain